MSVCPCDHCMIKVMSDLIVRQVVPLVEQEPHGFEVSKPFLGNVYFLLRNISVSELNAWTNLTRLILISLHNAEEFDRTRGTRIFLHFFLLLLSCIPLDNCLWLRKSQDIFLEHRSFLATFQLNYFIQVECFDPIDLQVSHVESDLRAPGPRSFLLHSDCF